ncbi:flagellar type III secretion system protein FlhB [Pseudooceanicola onchidii]|uniref:flagellar type III secretion system protein FlhB n=1 Tax=Pseudooceanicola onchidii TaxID=2562279 RepID=UPI0010AAAF88|nr:flagellar type III secretion system protein FlhB [Pseudooceanicola onchidii]
MSDDDNDNKPHEPTQKKLDDARKKGEIPRSQDVSTAAVYGGLILAATAVGGKSLLELGTALQTLLGQADRMAELMVTDGAAPLMGGLFTRVGTLVAPFFVIPAMASILAMIVQRSFTVTPSKLMPKLSRISLISNAKNKFGRNGLFEFGKSFTKLLIYSVILGMFLVQRLPDMAGTIRTDPTLATGLLLRLSIDFMLVVLLVALVIGGIDFLWQRAEHLRKHRMSDKEIRDEHKEAEGDPHMKGERRARGQEIAMNQMMADVPQADVIITNPTHYAVALKWTREPGAAPICVAKGTDEIAAKIRQVAQENAVPIHPDPPTARALYATTDIGHEISSDHYRAVAAAIRFADQMRVRARKSWR